jgi:hypothetical protein
VSTNPPPHDRGVLDTSAIIGLPQLTDASALPSQPLITTITLAELSVGPLVAKTDVERASRQTHLQQAEADFDPLPFDSHAARAFGRGRPRPGAAAVGNRQLAPMTRWSRLSPLHSDFLSTPAIRPTSAESTNWKWSPSGFRRQIEQTERDEVVDGLVDAAVADERCVAWWEEGRVVDQSRAEHRG